MKRKGAGGFGIIFFMIALIIFASGAIIVYTVFMKPEKISVVPSFLNKSITEAVNDAERLGLVVQIESVASTLKEGLVLAQSPNAGTELRKGKVLVLQVAKGGEMHPVPNVTGKSLSAAQDEIKSQGFSLGDVVRTRVSGVQAGNVIAQNPASPANIASGRKIDLLIQEAGDSNGNVTIPDVNRMSESEAKNLLSASGIKVNGVDKVYSPIVPEGLAIETRPSAGTSITAGQGVILKVATQRRPAGYMDADSNSNSNVRKVTSTQSTETQTQTQSSSSTTAQTQPQTRQQTPQEAIRQATQQNQNNLSTTLPTTQTQTQTQSTAQSSSSSSSNGSKTARIRYVVPPIARPMNLRVELTDPSGKRDVVNKQVRSGETVTASAKYNNEAVLTYYLGGEFVWQERQK